MKPSGILVCQRCPQGVMHSIEVVNGVADCCPLLVQVMQEAKVAAATAKGGSLISSGAPCLCFMMMMIMRMYVFVHCSKMVLGMLSTGSRINFIIHF